MTNRVAFLFACLLACGDDAPAPADDASQPPRDAASRPPAEASLPRSDGGAAEPLTLTIGARGVERTCGDCAVLTAKPSGGVPPYEYTWSDPTLKGAGPHEICDPQPARYELTVRDNARRVIGDIGSGEAEVTAQASVELPCSAREVDAGPGFSGCKVLFDANLFDIFDPSGANTSAAHSCFSLDGGAGVPSTQAVDGGMPVAQYLQLPEPMRAGQAYAFSFELLLPLTVGGDLRMELWGSDGGCSPDEKLGEIRIVDGVVQNACLTPTRAFDKILAKAGEVSEAPLLAFSLGLSMTLCSTCDKAGP
jgi:hypothetical protein